SYTNEMQAQFLRDQAAELGIQRMARPSQGSAEDEERAPIGYDEGVQRTRAYARQFEAQRRSLDRDKNKTVSLSGETPVLIPGAARGAPVEGAPEPGPKGPE